MSQNISCPVCSKELIFSENGTSDETTCYVHPSGECVWEDTVLFLRQWRYLKVLTRRGVPQQEKSLLMCLG